MDDETLSGASTTSPGRGDAPGYPGDHDASAREVGSAIAGDYRIEGRLGAGGMGAVYLARQLRLDRLVAVKELLFVDAEGTQRMLREATAMARLDHPNVVRIFDAREVDGRLVIAMEYLPGGTLRTWCSAHDRTMPDITEMFTGAARGLAAAHTCGIVHRDFKPDNVLIAADGTPKVADFGIARTVVDGASSVGNQAQAASDDAPGSTVTRTGALLGTPAYMAPEQYEGRADAKSDQFAFCVALFEALYGKRPYHGSTPAELWLHASKGILTTPPADANVPSRVLHVLKRGLSPNPRARHRNLDSLVRALRRATAPRGPLIAAVASTSVLVAATIVGGWWFFFRNDDPPPPVGSAVAERPVSSNEEETRVGTTSMTGDVRDAPVTTAPARSSAAGPPTTWEPGETFVCDHPGLVFQDITAIVDGGIPIIVAREGCRLRCTRCNLHGDLGVVATGDAHVELRDSRLVTRSTTATVEARARLTIQGGTTVNTADFGAAFLLSQESQLSISGAEVRATAGGIMAKDRAQLLLEDAHIGAPDYAIVADAGTTIRKKNLSLEGSTSIEGTVLDPGED